MTASHDSLAQVPSRSLKTQGGRLSVLAALFLFLAAGMHCARLSQGSEEEDGSIPYNSAPREADGIAALNWLIAHQGESGFWSASKDGTPGNNEQKDVPSTAAAALALLHFGHTHDDGSKYAAPLLIALKALKNNQDQSGRFASTLEGERAACAHILATLALSEAYGATSQPLFKVYAERGAKAVDSKDLTTPENLLWGMLLAHSLEDNKIQCSDALKETLLSEALKALKTPDQEPASLLMTATAVCVLKREQTDEQCQRIGLHRLHRYIPNTHSQWKNESFQDWLSGMIALRDEAAETTQLWSKNLIFLLGSLQEQDEQCAGSWNPDHFAKGVEHGRVFITAVNAITLSHCGQKSDFVPPEKQPNH